MLVASLIGVIFLQLIAMIFMRDLIQVQKAANEALCKDYDYMRKKAAKLSQENMALDSKVAGVRKVLLDS